jgi:hypothetical protein
MYRSLILIAVTACTHAAPPPPTHAGPPPLVPTPDAQRVPPARAAEEAFFDALLREPATRPAVEAQLTGAWAADPNDARTNLLLGLVHLWALAEGSARDPAALQHAILGDFHFARYERLEPNDRRVPSWHIPILMTLATVERAGDRLPALAQEFRAAYERDPAFHSVSLAMRLYHQPADSAEFRDGRAILSRADATCGKDAVLPDCRNEPRWSHNVQGFLLFRADYALRSNDLKEAEALLQQAKKEAGWDTFPFKREVQQRLADLPAQATRLAGGAPMILDTGSGVGCQVCHRAN